MTDIEASLGEEAGELLGLECLGIRKEAICAPGPDFIDRVVSQSSYGELTILPRLRICQGCGVVPMEGGRVLFASGGRS